MTKAEAISFYNFLDRDGKFKTALFINPDKDEYEIRFFHEESGEMFTIAVPNTEK